MVPRQARFLAAGRRSRGRSAFRSSAAGWITWRAAVAALVYRRQQHTINVFISPASDSRLRESARSRFADSTSITGFASGMSFWAVSDLNDAELGQFVHALQTS